MFTDTKAVVEKATQNGFTDIYKQQLISLTEFEKMIEPDAKLAVYAHLAQAENDLKHGRVQNMDDAINEILSELNAEDVAGVR